ncbi:MAG: polysaccharide export protein [Proteobacteria bacterium]|nr:polysaccharide export protein [Pseudomonadota bacterium]
MRRPSVLTLAGWLALTPLIISCASSPYATSTPAAPAQVTASAPAGATAPAGAAAGTGASPASPAAPAVSPDYIIGPGDTLQVFVWRNPELSVSVPVRPDGKISTPLVEDMVAVGKTAPQLARDMEGVLAEYVRTPKVNIIVTTAASAFSLVKVVGQVAHPMALPYREGMTVLDAVLEVGGLGQFASGNRSKLIRVVNGKETVIHIKLADLVNSGDIKENIPLKPGDVLVVPQSIF